MDTYVSKFVRHTLMCTSIHATAHIYLCQFDFLRATANYKLLFLSFVLPHFAHTKYQTRVMKRTGRPTCTNKLQQPQSWWF